MARVIGTPGRSAGIRAIFSRVVLPLLLGVFLLPLAAVMYASAGRPLYLLAAIASAAITLWWCRESYLEMYREIRGGGSWWKGAQGEWRVGAELSKLGDDYVVFHDFRFRSDESDWHEWNVDHIVVGPNGVFVIETKNYGRKTVRPADKSKHTRQNIQEVRRCAMDLKTRLVRWSNMELEAVFVEGWLVYAQPGARIERQREGQTRVLALRHLVGDIERRAKHEMDSEQQFRVAFALWNQLSVERRVQFEEAWAGVAQGHKVEREQRREQVRAGLTKGVAVDPVPTRCPECGAPLVRHTAGSGPRKGQGFLGCANWWKTGCKYKYNFDEPAA